MGFWEGEGKMDLAQWGHGIVPGMENLEGFREDAELKVNDPPTRRPGSLGI